MKKYISTITGKKFGVFYVSIPREIAQHDRSN